AMEPEDFLAAGYKGKTVGLDGKRTSISFVKKLQSKDLRIRSIDIYSKLIENRAPLSKDKLKELEIEYTGLSRKEKLDNVKYCLGGKAHIINNLESIAYLLNLRGNDIACTPVFLSFMVFYKDDVYFFIDVNRFKAETLDALYEDGIIIRPYDSYYEFLKTLKRQTVILDEAKVNYETYRNLLRRGNTIVSMTSIVEEMKAIKNDTEIENLVMANVYDGVVMVKFLKWMSEQNKEELDEYEVADTLNGFRLGFKAFDLSFNPIVAYNANAAMMHYAPSKEKCSKLKNEGILLIDSGGQYKEGTTDITRTFALGPVSAEIKKHFTIVLKSMLNLSEVRFMSGLSGKQLDILARKDIWKEGIDYRCGTGHGVGQVLSVHEAPPNIRYMKTANGSEDYPLRPGHVVTDEPGIYLEGKYGIRCENMLLVQKDIANEYGQFLSFRTLTLCPFDLDLIDTAYLDGPGIKALNRYHQEVYDKLSPYLNDEEKEYLRKATKEIA
ncbi:MAG: aminopeptidase P family protein, partial [Erysipelotrichaceae bacterium]|nr:aminopeptidase P family protein [Erysipelotrichaceae bacterium]